MKRFSTFMGVMCALTLPFGLTAQITFTNGNAALPDNNEDFNSGVAIGVTDLNEDGLDDIIHMDEGNDLHLELQQGDGSFQTIYVGEVSGQSQWSMCVADLDNNGFADVITGGAYDNVKLARANATGDGYTIANVAGANLFLQGSNFADINNDGWLDVFACHDDAESVIWGNDGAGNLILSNDWIDMATVPASDNSGNYGSIWTDFDNDGDLDLYIAKCRQGVSNPADPRRINALFVNDGAGNYTELADEYGLKIGAQSWTADFNDIDNDGDLDCFITNHDVPSMLLENDGTGHFTDITDGAGINVSGTPIQGVMRDFDNDGYVDILVAGGEANLFINNGDKTFTKIPNTFNDQYDMESYAIGDLNHDGLLDVYGGYANIYTNPTNYDDILWINTTDNDNHFLSVRLRGTDSNRSAVGARVTIEGDFGTQVREVRSGESYGIMNSMILHFGLGNAPTVDQLTIHWPSGTISVYEDIDVDQFLFYEESGCTPPQEVITANGPTTICSGETVELSAPAGYQYEWSNGATTQSITVTEPGNYYVLVSEDGSCFGQTPAIQITVDPVEIPTLTIDGPDKFCLGETTTLTSSVANSYEWSNGATTQSIEVTESGTYSVSAEGLCDFFESESVEIEVFDAPEPAGDDQVIGEPQSVTLTVTGDNPSWYDADTGGNFLASGNTYETPVLDATTTYYVEDLVNFEGEVVNTGQLAHSGVSQYNGDTFNGELFFDVYEPFVLESVNVITDTEGIRRIVLQNSNGDVLGTQDVDAGFGQTVVTLDWLILPGEGYVLTTDGDINQQNLGYNSPRFMRSSSGVDFPYVADDAMAITGSNGGKTYYYYFYNWQINKQGIDCVSDRTPVTVTFDPTSATGGPLMRTDGMQIFPNPTSDDRVFVRLEQVLPADAQFRLLTQNGQVQSVRKLGSGTEQFEVDLAGLPDGFYLVEVITEEYRFLQKLIRM